jgi:hypothetical protein
VSDQDFLFAVDVSGDPADGQMVADLASTLLGHIGYESGAIATLSGELRTALAGQLSNGEGRCEVRFRTGAGQLEIVVAAAGRAGWRTTRPLPAS